MSGWTRACVMISQRTGESGFAVLANPLLAAVEDG
jgi:hypothetical protein